MELDPSRWPVSLAGFFYDWMITREWKRVFTGLLPLGLLGTAAGLVWAGSQLDSGRLASWYLELGDQEIVEWEQAWAPMRSAAGSTVAEAAGQTQDTKTSPEAQNSQNTNAPAAESSPPEAAGAGTDQELSRFSETLFRRVQLLEPSKRSQFVIGATLAQRGASEQAVRLLTEIAPHDRAGYAPAHAYLTMIYLREVAKIPQGEPAWIELAKKINHHALSASPWDRTPAEVLIQGSNALWNESKENKTGALEILEKAAVSNPMLYIDLARRAHQAGSISKRDEAIAKATKYLSGRLRETPKDAEARVALAEVTILNGNWNAKSIGDVEAALRQAGDILEEGLKLESEPRLRRGLSEVYRLLFVEDLRKGDRQSAKIGLLDLAMSTDPSNEKVAEQVALLARVGGAEPSQELVTMLQEFLAQGKATATTHAWLSEVYLLRGDFEKAIPHLEQVVTRLPNAGAQLNNLAYVLADRFPARLDEALEFAKRSIAASSSRPNANYFDTLGIVFAKLGRTNEAIAAFESAISLENNRPDFRRNLAEQYRKLGNEAMALIHEKMVVELEKKMTAAAAANTPAAASTPPNEANANGTPVETNPVETNPVETAPAGEIQTDSDAPAAEIEQNSPDEQNPANKPK